MQRIRCGSSVTTSGRDTGSTQALDFIHQRSTRKHGCSCSSGPGERRRRLCKPQHPDAKGCQLPRKPTSAPAHRHTSLGVARQQHPVIPTRPVPKDEGNDPEGHKLSRVTGIRLGHMVGLLNAPKFLPYAIRLSKPSTIDLSDMATRSRWRPSCRMSATSRQAVNVQKGEPSDRLYPSIIARIRSAMGG